MSARENVEVLKAAKNTFLKHTYEQAVDSSAFSKMTRNKTYLTEAWKIICKNLVFTLCIRPF